MTSFLNAAKWYIKNNISVIVTDENKRSLFQWKRYQKEVITVEEVTSQLQHPKANGIAVVCGPVSGNIEVIDIDSKYDLTGNLFLDLRDRINKELLDKLYIVETKSGGYHIYYKCEVIEQNQKLARRPCTEQELHENPQLKFITIIETRGEGGYVCAPPTSGYKLIQNKIIPIISVDEREAILSACRSFNSFVEVVENKRPSDTRQYGISPFEDYNEQADVPELLVKHGWTIVKETSERVIFKRPGNTDSKTSGDYLKEKQWFSVFTTNSCFEPCKAYLPYAVYTMLECKGDFKLAFRKLVEQGYGEKRQEYGTKIEKAIFKKKQDGYSRDELIKFAADGKTIEEATEIVDNLEKKWGERLCTFWDVDKAGKVAINLTRLERFLSDTGGFYLYYYDSNSTIYRIVQIKDGVAEEASTEQIKKFIKNYINGLPDSFDGGITPDDLLEVVYKGVEKYFGKGFLEFIERKHIDILKDTATEGYFPFRNGIVVVNKQGEISLKTYGEIGKVVWKEQINDFEITVDQHFDITLVEYFKFLQQISNGEEYRWGYALSLIGYMLHSYKDPATPYAPILAEETEDERRGGGTGKGIFIKAISYIIPTVRIDGKNFKIDKNFAFQRVNLGTRLVVIEDCPKAVDFEKYYPTITEGITIEKKNKDELFLPYSDSPKIAFTTNYSIAQNAEHAKRRQKVFEFAPHYNSKFTPVDEFGHKLFDDWDRDEWNRFYNLMFWCVGIYLQGGIPVVDNSEKMVRKHIKLNYGEEFLEYLDEKLGNGYDTWVQFGMEYTHFININGWDKKDFSNKKFKKGLRDCAIMMGYNYVPRRNKQMANAHEFRFEKLGT